MRRTITGGLPFIAEKLTVRFMNNSVTVPIFLNKKFYNIDWKSGSDILGWLQIWQEFRHFQLQRRLLFDIACGIVFLSQKVETGFNFTFVNTAPKSFLWRDIIGDWAPLVTTVLTEMKNFIVSVGTNWTSHLRLKKLGNSRQRLQRGKRKKNTMSWTKRSS